MNETGRRTLWTVTVTVALAAVGLAGCQGQDQETTSDGKPIVRIGVSAAFTGATAYYGQEAEAGVRIAVDELNAADPARHYEVVTADDECTPAGGASAYGNLIDVKQVDVIIGSACSGATLSGMALLPPATVPNVVVSSTSPKITEQAGVGGNQYVWRMNIGDDVMARAFSRHLADAGLRKVAVIAVNNDFGRAGAGAYKAELPKVGIQVATDQYYTQGAGEFRAPLTNIKASGAEAMLIVGAHGDAAVMMRQVKELGLKIRVYARGDVVSKAFQEAAGDPNLGNGIVEANNWDATYGSYPDFAASYRQRYQRDAQSSAVQAYLGAKLVGQAVQAGGPDRAGIQAGLAKVSWRSPLGPIAFDEHHQAHHDLFLLEFVDGKIVLKARQPTAVG